MERWASSTKVFAANWLIMQGQQVVTSAVGREYRSEVGSGCNLLVAMGREYSPLENIGRAVVPFPSGPHCESEHCRRVEMLAIAANVPGRLLSP